MGYLAFIIKENECFLVAFYKQRDLDSFQQLIIKNNNNTEFNFNPNLVIKLVLFKVILVCTDI